MISKILLRLLGWKTLNALPGGLTRCVMIAAPHTSNWDFLYARLTFNILRIPLKFTIKKDWMKPPFGWFLRKMGALPIDRTPKTPGGERPSMVDAMAELFANYKDIVVMVTPEGTRSKVTKWKTGFYWVAKQANVPIALGYLDYKKKEAGVGKIIWPSGDIQKDLQEIMAFYRSITPKFPEKFSIDLDYATV